MKKKVRHLTDVMVSVRMPKSLSSALRDVASKEHFLDVSETIRSIVRKRWAASTNPELYRINQIRSEITQQVKRKATKRVKDEVAKELDKLKETLVKNL